MRDGIGKHPVSCLLTNRARSCMAYWMQTVTRSSAQPNVRLNREAGVVRSKRSTGAAPHAPLGRPERRALVPYLLLVACSVVSQQPLLRRRMRVLVALLGAVATGILQTCNFAGAATRRIAMAYVFLFSLVRHVLAEDLAETTIYGSVFESSSIIAYAEVVQTCFGGLQVGSCEVSSPNWLKDFLDQYNDVSTGTYCASCCSNSDVSGDTWAFDCDLVSTAFAEFVNKFGWEFRFGRRETSSDESVTTCPIPRTACTYHDNGSLAADCVSDGSFLEAYVLTLEVMTVEKGLKSWKSVQSCSVEAKETDAVPTSLLETIIMTQVQGEGVAVETGWALLISFAAFTACSFGVRFARDEHCTICGHHLIWLQTVCLPCRFYGYDPPSKDVAEIIKQKRAVVLPEPTLAERFGTMKANTTKVFVQATETFRSTAFGNGGNNTTSITSGALDPASCSNPDRFFKASGPRSAACAGVTGDSRERYWQSGIRRSEIGGVLAGVRRTGGDSERGNPTGLSSLGSARSVVFADDIHTLERGRTGTIKAKCGKGAASSDVRESSEGDALRKSWLRRSFLTRGGGTVGEWSDGSGGGYSIA